MYVYGEMSVYPWIGVHICTFAIVGWWWRLVVE